MKQQGFVSQNEAKYRNARISLLTILIFSTLNLILVGLADMYFLFSAYIPLITTAIGFSWYTETGVLALYIIAIILALIMIVPYLLCWLFSKKKVGWMIGALVLFSLDTVLFLFDFFSYIAVGEYSSLLDLAFHVCAIVSLILGVKYGLIREKEEANTAAAEEILTEAAVEAPEEPQLERTLTLTRKKSFVGCAALFVCFVDNKEVCRLKNGETKNITVSQSEFVLGVMLANGLSSEKIKIGTGSNDLFYQVSIKSGMMASTIEITPMDHH